MFDFLKKSTQLVAPMTGEAVDITDLSDPVFSQKMVGDGVAILPSEGEVVSPVDGKVVQLFETGHAIGIRTGEIEILLHIGMDTVELKGDGFETYVEVGDEVRAGDLLIRADLSRIRELGKSTDTPVVITQPAGKTIQKHTGSVRRGETVIMTLK